MNNLLNLKLFTGQFFLIYSLKPTLQKRFRSKYFISSNAPVLKEHMCAINCLFAIEM